VGRRPVRQHQGGGTLTGTLNRSDWGSRGNVPSVAAAFPVSEKVKLEVDGELGEDKPAVEEAATERLHRATA